MNAQCRKLTTLAAILTSVSGVASVTAQNAGEAQRPLSPMTPNEPLALFAPVTAGPVDPEANEPRVLRSRAVRFDAGELARLNPTGCEMHTIRLFDDVEVVATFKQRKSQDDGSITWTGALDDHPYSSFVFAVVDGVMVGQFRSITQGTFSVRYLGDGIQVIRELNRSGLAECGGDVQPPADPQGIPVAQPDPNGDGSGGDGPIVPRDDGSVIDVFVAYTNAARSSEGGTTAMRALIAATIEDINLRHSNSGTNVQFRLVGFGEVAYTETGSSSTDLSRLRNSTDGYMDIVHTWRDLYAADVVTLIEDSMDSGVAGLGYRPSSASQMIASSAFSVVLRSSADDGTAAHEIGHNLGCHHHPDDDSGSGPASGDTTIYPYAFGHRFYAGWWFRTTMAYDPNGFYSRIDYFSDPTRTYNDQPIGITGERNNAEVIRQTHATMANYRQSLFPNGVTWLSFSAACPCDGTLSYPVNNLLVALAMTPANGTIATFTGSTAWAGQISQPVTLRTWGPGTVQIGQ